MSTYTNNLNLIKQAGTEHPQVAGLNDNFDKIDAAVGMVDVDQDGSLQSQVDNVNTAIGTVDVDQDGDLQTQITALGKSISRGTESFTATVNGSATWSTTVSFPQAFQTIPSVVATSDQSKLVLSIDNVSTNGFGLNVRNVTSVAQAGFMIRWIAVA